MEIESDDKAEDQSSYINEKGMKINRIMSDQIDPTQSELNLFNQRIEKIENLSSCHFLKVI